MKYSYMLQYGLTWKSMLYTGKVVDTHTPGEGQKQEHCKVKVSMGYPVRPFFQNNYKAYPNHKTDTR